MFKTLRTSSFALILLTGFVTQAACAASPEQILESIHQEASVTPGFRGFSATRGEHLFNSKHGNDWSCSSCHTGNPTAQGTHAKTGKTIQPLAPSANAERFSDQKKVDKWFKRNCNDVLNRACSAQEKGDFLSYMLSFNK